ncbi:hypothetical protein MMC10_002408 [Thelotrema lepadinum]|nr:hypothetical protein [Thelotrema lepadinum]
MSGWIGDFDYIKTHTSQPDLHMATPGSYSETVSAAAYRNHTKVLEYLLDLDPSKGNMESALSSGVGVAGHLGIAKIVSSRYPELLQDKQCLASILDSAARFGHIKVVQYLLDKHALSKKRGSKLISRALYRACEGGHTAIVEYLLHRIDSEILGWMITSYGLCLRAAARRGNADVMALLLSANDPKLSPSYPILGYLEEIDVINDPLSEAAKFGHVPIVRLLLERAVLTGDSEHEYGVQEALAAAIANEQYAVVELLLSRRHGGQ